MAGEKILLKGDQTWRLVKYAWDCRECDVCGEPFCDDCGQHYADCECPGPHQDDEMEYAEFDGYEYATPIVTYEDLGHGTNTETE